MPNVDQVSRLRALAAYAAEDVVLLDPGGGVVEVVYSGRGTLGFDEHERTEIRLIERVHPDDLVLIMNAFGRILQQASHEESLTVRARHRDGDWLTVDVTLIDARDDPALGGVVLRARSTGVESERHRVSSLAGLLDHGVMVGSLYGELVYSNEAARRLLGWDSDDPHRHSWAAAFDPAQAGEILDAVHLALAGRGGPFRFQVSVAEVPDRWVEVTVSALDPAELGVGFLIVLSDVTELRQSLDALAASEALHRRIAETVAEGLLLYGPDGRIARVFAGVSELLGAADAQLVGVAVDTDFGLVDADQKPMALEAYPAVAALRGEQIRDEVVGIPRRGGGYAWFSVNADPFPMPEGRGALVALRDIGLQRQAERARDRFFDLSSDPILVAEADGTPRHVNTAFRELFGWVDDELTGLRLRDFVHPDDLDAARTAYHQLVQGKEVRFEGRFPTASGSWRVVVWRLVPDTDSALLYAIGRDITDQRATERRLRHQAATDPLTGLPNRTAVHDHIELRLAQDDDAEFVVLFVDLDGFKAVNDRHGHATGDRILEAAADALRRACRTDDFVGRWAGDEFIALCTINDRAEVELVADRILAELSAPLDDAIDERVSASIGIAFSDAGTTADALIAAADTALYAAKRAGRGRYAYAPGPG